MNFGPNIPLFYFGAQNAPHVSLWTDPNAFWGAGMGNGGRYVFDQRRPMLAQLDYQWAGSYPKDMWDPLPFYRGASAAPVLNQERLGTFMRAQPEFNELGYQNVLLRDNGVPVGGEIASTPNYRFNGPIQPTYMGFMRPVADADTQPEILPDWQNIPATQAQAEYGVTGGGPFSDPPLQPPGFGTVRGGIGGNWPLYAYRPAHPPQLPPPASSDPQMANTNPAQGYVTFDATARSRPARFRRRSNPDPSCVPCEGNSGCYVCTIAGCFCRKHATALAPKPTGETRGVRRPMGHGMARRFRAPNPQGRQTPLMIVNPSNGEDTPTMFDSWISPNAMARATRQNPLSNPMIGGGPGYSGHLNPNMSGMGSMTGYVPNPGLPGVPLTVAPPFSATGWMRPAARGPNPANNPCTKDSDCAQEPCAHTCLHDGTCWPVDVLCGTFSAGPSGGGMPSRPGVGFATRGRRGAPMGGRGTPSAYSGKCGHNDDCGPLETCENGVCTQVDKPKPALGGVARRARKAAVSQVGSAPAGAAFTRNLVSGRRGGGATVAQAVTRNPAGRFTVRTQAGPSARGVARGQRLAGGAQARGIFCKLFPNSGRCSTISAAPHAGCRWNVTTQTWHCPSEGARPGGARLTNPGVVPVGTYPVWSGHRASRATLAKALNPDACCDGCAESGGSCGGGCGCKGNCDGSCKSQHRHHNP